MQQCDLASSSKSGVSQSVSWNNMNGALSRSQGIFVVNYEMYVPVPR